MDKLVYRHAMLVACHPISDWSLEIVQHPRKTNPLQPLGREWPNLFSQILSTFPLIIWSLHSIMAICDDFNKQIKWFSAQDAGRHTQLLQSLHLKALYQQQGCPQWWHLQTQITMPVYSIHIFLRMFLCEGIWVIVTLIICYNFSSCEYTNIKTKNKAPQLFTV